MKTASPWIKSHLENAHEEKVANSDVAAWEADRWQDSGLFDWYVTFTFDDRTHKANGLKRPDRVYVFVKRELERFGYFGPFVIVPHDNYDTRYYHAHCLLANYKAGLCERLSDEFARFGNVQKVDDGPIRGRGAFLYCANRAVDYWTKDTEYEERLKWKRRPRKRGSGRGDASQHQEVPTPYQDKVVRSRQK